MKSDKYFDHKISTIIFENHVKWAPTLTYVLVSKTDGVVRVDVCVHYVHIYKILLTIRGLYILWNLWIGNVWYSSETRKGLYSG